MTKQSRFDLVDEPWLSCVRRDGRRVELGLRAVLVEAHELSGLFDPSPLVTVALHRLLLAVLHRAYLGPPTFDDWADLWQAGRWDPSIVGDYLDRWRPRFDLFDPERPFFGVLSMEGARTLPVTLLAVEAASGNNATLFDHSLNAEPAPIAPGEAARRLVAQQAFALGGGKSQPFYLSDSPLVRDYSVLAFGETLFETVALNLLVYNRERPLPWTAKDDPPAWEQDEPRPPVQSGTPPYGYLDYLTWQSRRIHLMPDGSPLRVRWCQLRQNLVVAPDLLDPFKAYATSKEGGRGARRFDPGRAVWRDSHALLQHGEEKEDRRPELFNHLARLDEERRIGLLAARPVYTFGVFGLATVPGRASVELWRQERLPLPLAYLDDEALTAALGRAMALADDGAEALRRGIWALARLLLAPAADIPNARQPPQDEVRAVVRHLGADLPFWTRLETAFVRLLRDLPERAPRPSGEPVFAGAVRDEWLATLQQTARAAFEEAAAGSDGSGWTLKAVVHGRRLFEHELRQRLGPAA